MEENGRSRFIIFAVGLVVLILGFKVLMRPLEPSGPSASGDATASADATETQAPQNPAAPLGANNSATTPNTGSVATPTPSPTPTLNSQSVPAPQPQDLEKQMKESKALHDAMLASEEGARASFERIEKCLSWPVEIDIPAEAKKQMSPEMKKHLAGLPNLARTQCRQYLKEISEKFPNLQPEVEKILSRNRK